MKVLCTGPESSGTRLLTRLVGSLGVDAIHRSVPHAMDWWNAPSDIDRFIVVVRDPFVTEVSAKEAGHPSYWSGIDSTFPYRVTKAWETIIDNVRGKPWIPITYEGLLLRPQKTLDNIADWMGVAHQPVTEKIDNPRSFDALQ